MEERKQARHAEVSAKGLERAGQGGAVGRSGGGSGEEAQTQLLELGGWRWS